MAGTKVEVYGFAGWITSYICFALFIFWSWLPTPVLHQLGINYYPSKYWAVAIPTYIGVVWMLSIVGYLAINLISTPSLDSKYTVTDEIFREMDEDTQMNSVEGHIPPIVDIPIDVINKFLYHGPSDQKL